MPPARLRSGKHRGSSSSSYTSTVTTLVFIALCCVGAWMLTSHSGVSLRTTNHMSDSTAFASADNHALLSTEKIERIEQKRKRDQQPAFEDNQDDLPTDAIKNDDSKSNDENDATENNGDKEEASNESDNAAENSEATSEKESVEEQEKQNEIQNQISEESSKTQSEQADQANKENSESEGSQGTSNANEEESTAENGENSRETRNVTTDQIDQQDTEEKKQEIQNVDNNNNRQESQNQDSNGGQQQPDEAESEDNSQETQETKTDEEQQQEDDSGIQSTPLETKNEVSETDEQQIIQEQKRLREEDSGGQSTPQETENKVSETDQQQSTQEQRRQHEEDYGIQSTPKEMKNELSEEDQQQRIQEQRRQQKEGKQYLSLENQVEYYYQQAKQASEQALEDATQQPEKETDTKTMQVVNKESQNNENQNQDIKQDITESTSGKSSFSDGGVASGIPKESSESKDFWSTQATESENEKERRKDESDSKESMYGFTWELCNVTASPDYIPCLDNVKALRKLRSTKHFEHRERHCPEEGPTCLVPRPQGYKRPIPWPQSRDKIWYHNIPHTTLAEVKGHQNWVKVTGEFLTFPGGGTQFIHGAQHYIDFLQKAVPDIAWGNRTRVILDIGCGVASFGGYLFDSNVLAMSFAPKDEHEAQVQFALERGIPAISAVMGSQRLPFPSMVFDLVHCARCRVPWHAEGGKLLLELNRVLRPGGYFVWSATPVYQKLPEDVEIWEAMSALTVAMCWELVTIKKDKLNSIGAAIYRKPTSNECYEQRKDQSPPMCKNDDDPNAAWYVPLQACMHKVPEVETKRGSHWPKEWPDRVETPPYWLKKSKMGIYGKPAPQDFVKDCEHWKHMLKTTYMKALGIDWSNVRNVMDMRAVYGGFAAALKDLNVWVLNVVNIDSPDTLPIVYERGLFGIYHDWCESFSTYPRTYDLLHADHLFSKLQKRCKLPPAIVEVDRIVRPGGKLIVRDESNTIGQVQNLLKSLRWEVQVTSSKDQEGLLSAQKGDWRPTTFSVSSKQAKG